MVTAETCTCPTPASALANHYPGCMWWASLSADGSPNPLGTTLGKGLGWPGGIECLTDRPVQRYCESHDRPVGHNGCEV